MNCSQPRRKGTTVRLLLRVYQISLPPYLKDYYLREIIDYRYIDCFLLGYIDCFPLQGNKGRMHCFLLQPAKRQPSLVLLLPASRNKGGCAEPGLKGGRERASAESPFLGESYPLPPPPPDRRRGYRQPPKGPWRAFYAIWNNK
jgi:hypothetical protein